MPPMNASPLHTLTYAFDFGPLAFRRECHFPVSLKQSVNQQSYFNDFERIGSTFCRNLRPELADLAEVATALYCADRFSPRRHPDHRNDALPLSRRIRLRISVRRPGLWCGRPREILVELLHNLCGDVWELEFTQLSAENSVGTQGYLLDFQPPHPPKVMLFSGGLDSYAGAAFQLEDPAHFHVLVAGWTHTRMQQQQAAQADRLLAGRKDQGHYLPIKYGMSGLPKFRLETSQRTRGILHMSLGAVTALQLGAGELHIYENGYGALNLPFDETQMNWEVSRAVHPQTLRLMERLVSEVCGQRFAIRMPFGFETKAEALGRPEARRFAAGIRETFSCDRFPDHFEGKPQCGICSSCVLRRMSLECAGLAAFDPADDYAFDVEASDALPKPRAAFVLDKYDAQASRFRQALAAQNPWRELVRHWPDLRAVETALAEGGTPQAEIQPQLLRLLRQHAEEWSRFSGRTAFERYLHAA